MHGQWCKYWTLSAYECYKRGCICTGCPIKELMECRCDMKRAVIELVRKFGVPNKEEKEEKEFTAYEWSILNVIKGGCSTIKEIADNMGKSESSIVGMIHQLYGKARLKGWNPIKKGAVSKNLLPQFIKFVQSGGFEG